MPRRSRIFWSLCLLVALTVSVVFLGISFREWQEWRAARAILMAKGEKLAQEDLLPGPVREEDNFFADPIWRELSDRDRVEISVGLDTAMVHRPRLPKDQRQLGVFRRRFEKSEQEALRAEFPEFWALKSSKEPLEAMGGIWRQTQKEPGLSRRSAEFTLRMQTAVEPVIGRLRELARRPDAYFPLEYQDGPATSADHAAALGEAGRWLAFRARAELALGNIPAAFQDAVLIFRFQEALRRDRLYYPFWNEMSLVASFTDVVDWGVRAQAWSAGELQEFDRLLESVDLSKRAAQTLRFERAHMLDVNWPGILEQNATLPGFFGLPTPSLPVFAYRYLAMPGDKALYSLEIQQCVENLDAASQKGMNQALFPNLEEKFQKTHPGTLSQLSKSVGQANLSWAESVPRNAARTQTSVRLTRIGIALERARLQHGQYPEELAALEKDLPGDVLRDLITGEPYHYRRNDGGDFALWSVGWNEIDENGHSERNFDKGDWAWGD